MPERALVVIPTYNEAVNVPQIVPQVLSQDPRLEVLVVDDHSPDGTGRIVDDMMFIGCPIAQVVDAKLERAGFLRPFHDAFAQRRPADFRKKGDDIDAHRSSLSW